MRLSRNRTEIAMAMVALFLCFSMTVDAYGALNAVGPTDPINGFPMWYRDRAVISPAGSLTLEPCMDTNGLCLLDPAVDLPNPAAAVSFPDNFPEEIFWWTADSTIVLPRVANRAQRALLILALEGAFGGGPVLPGDQVTFGRVRIRIDTPVAGDYTVIHPYGTETFVNVPAGRRAINMTRDIGIGGPGDFTGALGSDIGPFLTWDPITDAPAGYVGDPGVEHVVTGSPTGNNFFEITGPAGANLDGAGGNVVQSNLFVVSGKLATRFGVTVNRATYTRDTAGATTAEVFASSGLGQTIAATVGAASAPMLEAPAGTGKYYARFGAGTIGTPAVPDVTVTNSEINQGVDRPDTVVTEPLVDVVTVANAQYQPAAPAGAPGSLLVNATSSDGLPGAAVVLTVRNPPLDPLPTISADLFNTDVLIPGFAFPSPHLILRSSQGGVYNANLPIVDPAPVAP